MGNVSDQLRAFSDVGPKAVGISHDAQRGKAGWTPPSFSSLPVARVLLPFYHQTSDVVEFMGPLGYSHFGENYVCLTHGGLKPEAEPYPGDMVWTEAEAWHRFRQQFAAYTQGAEQIAYRSLPSSEQTADGNWHIRCRLLAFRRGSNA